VIVHHGAARAKEILSAGDPLVTTDHVLVETWTLLRWRLHRDAAEAFWRAIRSGVASLEPVGPADLQAAWTIGQDFPDQDFSVVDRTSRSSALQGRVRHPAPVGGHTKAMPPPPSFGSMR
jgi:predicted nucleic acid-binding protein